MCLLLPGHPAGRLAGEPEVLPLSSLRFTSASPHSAVLVGFLISLLPWELPGALAQSSVEPSVQPHMVNGWRKRSFSSSLSGTGFDHLNIKY